MAVLSVSKVGILHDKSHPIQDHLYGDNNMELGIDVKLYSIVFFRKPIL